MEKKYKNVIRVATFKTEKSKSAILTAARGLGYSPEEGQYWASMIVADRGQLRTLKQTYYGDVENEMAPNKAFQEEMNKYPDVWETAQKIEGLVTGLSSHAGGVLISEEPIYVRSSKMKLKSGEFVSAFDLHAEEQTGGLKIDLLATQNLTRMRTCLELLIQYGYIERKPTLKETYENAIGIYTTLDRNNKKGWDMLAKGEVLSAFQYETEQGLKAVQFAHPQSLEELAALNSIMRLMASEKGAEQPLDKFARFKKNPELWDKEMIAWGLTKEERELLHPYLDYEYGICASQED